MVAQGAILTLVVACCTAFTVRGQQVGLDVDGQTSHVSAYGRTVSDVLDAAGISVGDKDLVAPGLDQRAPLGGEIVVRTAHQLEVTVDGKTSTVWTTAQTVDEAVADLGVRADGALMSASRSDSIGRTGLSLAISTMKNFTVLVDGATMTTHTNASTVGEAVKSLGIVLGDRDQLSVPASAPAVEGLLVTVTRLKSTDGTQNQSEPFKSVQQDDPNLEQGKTKVIQEGKAGNSVITYSANVLDGREISRDVIATAIINPPVDEIVAVGSKEPVKVVSTSGVEIPAIGAGDARSIGRELAAQRGWGDDQYVCLDNLWTRESGWRTTAANPSGAYGIPQALPGSKMSSVGADWATNPATQITWGLNYIAGRYGDPCGAWASFQVKNWY